MADVLAVVGVAYPVVKDLFKLVEKLKRLHDHIRNAKYDLSRVIKRTISVAQTYDFFRDTMKVAKKIQELAPMFNRHQQLIRSVNKESKRTIERLNHITGKFRSLIDDEPVSTVERLIAQYEWSRESKKTVPFLFQEMKVLERSMRTIGTLVHIQLLSQTHRSNGSGVVLAQV
jgi:DNA repair ATPase RecN